MCAQGITNDEPRWIVYIIQCADKTLYTGITNDLDARLLKHAQGTGAKYTRGRAPFLVVFNEAHATKSAALSRELAIKKLSKNKKLALKNHASEH
jgi:predicted GIY-YIG superfamily endonuclease